MDSDPNVIVISIPVGVVPDRVDTFLSQAPELGGISKGALTKLFSAGSVSMNGAVVKKGNKVVLLQNLFLDFSDTTWS